MPALRLLGAILAGGASRRFGSDKALAVIDGQTMLDHVRARLAPQCDALVVTGRDWAECVRVDDIPGPGFGPLGGLAGALAHARAHGFDAVLTSACDLPELPTNLRERLGQPNAIVRGQPTIGLWKGELADRLADYLHSATDLSIRAWVLTVGARWVAPESAISNINTTADLAAFRPS